MFIISWENLFCPVVSAVINRWFNFAIIFKSVTFRTTFQPWKQMINSVTKNYVNIITSTAKDVHRNCPYTNRILQITLEFQCIVR